MSEHNFDPSTEEECPVGEPSSQPQPEENASQPAPDQPTPPEDPFQPTPPGNGWQNMNMQAPPPKKKKNLVPWIVGLSALYLMLVVGIIALVVTGAIQFDPVTEGGNPAGGEIQETKDEEDERSTFAPIEENGTSEDNTIVGEDYSGEALTASQLYQKNVGSVVFVKSQYRQGYSTGSGFVIDAKNGYILTNYHVVEEANKITVTFVDEKEYDATLVAGDEINDVAVLKISAEGLSNVTVGNSEKLKIGDDILVIGNPLGDLTFTLTKGIVSGVNREINTGEYTIRTFQTDAAINSGNSGGPAFDATGAVVGIASAKYSATGVEGIGFCIPIKDAMEIARDLVEYGYVKGRPNFGVTVSDYVDYQYSYDENGRRVVTETTGARIEEVGRGSCAEKGGMRVGDVVIKLGDKPVSGAAEMINLKNAYKAGDTVTVEVLRGNDVVKLSVTLDEYSPN